ncbi:putative hyaluronan/mRNA-binding protein [Dioscorea sansibarensis]
MVTEDNINTEENVVTEKQPEQEDAMSKENKDVAANDEAENKEEEKEMTLNEYEKIRKEKRKALLGMKTELRKVDFDKEFESMQRLSIKKGNDETFIKLCIDKDVSKRKENADQEERGRKMVGINEFLKPAEGERYYNPGGRGHDRGCGDRGLSRGGFGGAVSSTPAAPSIEDPSQFPTLIRN